MLSAAAQRVGGRSQTCFSQLDEQAPENGNAICSGSWLAQQDQGVFTGSSRNQSEAIQVAYDD